jgi:acyl-CoA thioesterase FadM
LTEVTRANARMIDFGYEIRAIQDDRLLATGYTKHCWLNRAMRPARLPEQYHSVLAIG